MEKYPQLQIQLVLSDQQIDPVQEGYDLTLRIADLPSSSLIARKIAPAARVICAAPSYLERRGAPRHPNELRGHDCLAYGHLATGNQWKLTVPTETIGSRFLGRYAQIMRKCCETLRSRGAASLCFRPSLPVPICSRAACEPSSRIPGAGNFRLRDLPATRHLSVKVRLMIDFLVERFGGRPYWDLVE